MAILFTFLDPARAFAGNKPRVLKDIPYTGSAGLKTDPLQSLDLYLPGETTSKPPLLIFIHGDLWAWPDNLSRLAPPLATTLQAKNVAVALVRYRPAPAYSHPTQVQDVAAAVAYLARKSETYGYDAGRIFIGGHSTGAHLAALAALDPRYLNHHGIHPDTVAGVVAISGV